MKLYILSITQVTRPLRSFTLILALVYTLTSCVERHDARPNVDDDCVQLQFNINESPLTRGVERGTDDENTINTMLIFFFSPDGKSLFNNAPYYIDTSTLTGEKKTKWNDEKTVLLDILPSQLGERIVYVIANPFSDHITELQSITTLPQLKKLKYQKFGQIPNIQGNNIPMVGHTKNSAGNETTFTFSSLPAPGGNRKVTIQMIRAVAKIRVTINLENTNFQNNPSDPKFKNRFKFMSMRDGTYYIENIEPLPSTYNGVEGQYEEAAAVDGTTDQITFTKYVYEGNYTDLTDSEKKLRITLKLPYHKEGLEQSLQLHNYYRIQLPDIIKRNTIYDIKASIYDYGISDPSGAETMNNIIVRPWDEVSIPDEKLYGDVWLELSDPIIVLNSKTVPFTFTATSNYNISYIDNHNQNRYSITGDSPSGTAQKVNLTITSDEENVRDFSPRPPYENKLTITSQFLTKEVKVRICPRIRIHIVTPGDYQGNTSQAPNPFVIAVSPEHGEIPSDVTATETPTPVPHASYYWGHVYPKIQVAQSNVQKSGGTYLFSWYEASGWQYDAATDTFTAGTPACSNYSEPGYTSGWRLPTEAEMKAVSAAYISNAVGNVLFEDQNEIHKMVGNTFWSASMDPYKASSDGQGKGHAFGKAWTFIQSADQYAPLENIPVEKKLRIRCVRDYIE